jgi:hypothetical protein
MRLHRVGRGHRAQCRPRDRPGYESPARRARHVVAAPLGLSPRYSRTERTVITTLAPTLQAYFTDRRLCQRRVSPNTVASYRDAFRLLLSFVQQKTGTPPARLELIQLDAPTIGAFPRARARKQRAHPQHPPRRGPLVLPLLRAAPPRARRADPAGACDPPETRREAHRHLPHARGGRRAARRPRPRDLGRTPRSRAAAHRRADRSARLRAARADPRRCLPRHRPARARDRQRTKGARRATDPPERRGAPGLDARVQGPARPVPAVPLTPRRAAHARRHRTPSCQARRDRPARLPSAALKASPCTCCATPPRWRC